MVRFVTPRVLPPVIAAPADGTIIPGFDLVIKGSAEPKADIYFSVGTDTPAFLVHADDNTGNFAVTVTLPVEGSNQLNFTTKASGSLPSTPVLVRTVIVDLKPSNPTGLAVDPTVNDTRVRLWWNRNAEPDIQGYNVYRDGNLVPITFVSQPPQGLVPELVDLALTNGRQYQYQVQAVDARGNKSGLSVPVAVTPAAGPEWGP